MSRRGGGLPSSAGPLIGWAVLALALHALLGWWIAPSFQSPMAEPERRGPEQTVIGQLDLADPVPAGPAVALLQPAARGGDARTLTWVPVPDRPRQEPVEPRESAPPEVLQPVAPPVAPLVPPLPPSPPLPPALPAAEPTPSTPDPVAGSPVDAATVAVAGAVPQARQPLPLGASEASASASTSTEPAAAPQALPPAAPSPALAEAASAALPEPAAGPPGAAAGATPGAPAFEWPPSTRLRYRLTGQYRGDIEGRAQVEWLREGHRYAVHLDIRVGLPFAPLMSRRMSSEGLLTPRGLAPERYDESTRVAVRDPRQYAVRLGPAFVQMADGRSLPAPVGVQDTASQFIQLAYRFSTEPGLLQPGRTVELPLALPRRLDIWTYDVVGPELLHTPFGTIEAVHLRPRPVARAGEVLRAEIWFAPRLRHLPVRIRIEQGPEVFVDLMIDRLPDVLAPVVPAARVPPPAPPPGSGLSPEAAR